MYRTFDFLENQQDVSIKCVYSFCDTKKSLSESQKLRQNIHLTVVYQA